jgi:hypothetical protein
MFPSFSIKIDSSKDDNNFCLLSISFFKLYTNSNSGGLSRWNKIIKFRIRNNFTKKNKNKRVCG